MPLASREVLGFSWLLLLAGCGEPAHEPASETAPPGVGPRSALTEAPDLDPSADGVAVRLAARDARADPGVAPDARPAGDLLPKFARACEAVAAASLDYGDRQQLPWDQFSGRSAQAEHERSDEQV